MLQITLHTVILIQHTKSGPVTYARMSESHALPCLVYVCFSLLAAPVTARVEKNKYRDSRSRLKILNILRVDGRRRGDDV